MWAWSRGFNHFSLARHMSSYQMAVSMTLQTAGTWQVKHGGVFRGRMPCPARVGMWVAYRR